MKQFLVFVRKEFYHVFRDKKSLLLLFGLPIVQIVLFGFALTNEIKNSNIVLCDFARDEVSQRIILKIESSQYFRIEHLLLSPRQIESSFKAGNIKLAIVFPEKLSEELGHLNEGPIQVIADASDPNLAITISNYINQIIADYQQEESQHMQRPNLQIVPITRMIYNPELKGTTNFVPGVMALVLMMVCVLMTSVSVVKEKENGSMEVLLVSPFHPLLVLLAKAVPYLVLSLVNLSIILLLSVFLLDLPVKGSVLLLFLESTLLIITALSLGLLISNIASSQQSAMLISLMGMLMPTMMFTGFMFPLENMPLPLQYIANLLPSKWYYIIVKDIMIKGLGITAIWKETLILLAMTLFLLGLSLKLFKIRLS